MAEFDVEAGQTYIYPTNYPLREYQFDIVKAALFKNTLVCLPTGLGKTFIGAVLIYNFYRWYPTGKVVFLAPTRPLVSQQIEACFNVMGIPQDHTAEMTGSTSPEARQTIWKSKRVFFLTPQVLMNDLSRGTCPLHVIKLIVVDEAHKALGNHAFCQVMKQLQQQCYNFRVLALSATPGSDIQAVQQVVSNLMISHIELRSEESPDIMQYTYFRSIEKIVIPIQGELKRIKDSYMEVVKYYVFKLIDKQVLYTKDETTVTKFQILKAREAFRQNPPHGCSRQMIGMLEGTFALCMTLYHAYELLLMHGIRSFYNFLKGSLDEKKGHFYGRGELNRNSLFMDLMNSLEIPYSSNLVEGKSEAGTSFGTNSTMANLNPNPVSHPKMEKLQQIVLDHFNHNQKMNQSTRVMIFSQYRDSVTEITALLRTFDPVVKAMSFIGQSSKGGKGITQKEQIRVVKQFRSGNYNTLVSTCVGEEGLDIGDVDLIVCYDAPKSPIRLVQRMGRTGRKRDGKIVVLVTKGKEEQSYMQSHYQRKSLTTALLRGDKLTRFFYPNCPRMVPDSVNPVCLKMKMQVRAYEPPGKESRGQKRKIDSYLTSRSGNKRATLRLNETELKMYEEKYKMEHNDVLQISRPSFGNTNGKLKDRFFDDDPLIFDGRRAIDFGDFQPWYTTLQSCYDISHSKVTRNLVHLTEFINLQQMIGENDNYSIEMAPFMDEIYFRNNEREETAVQNVDKRSISEGSDRSNVKMKSVKKGNINKKKKVKEKSSVNKGIKPFLVTFDDSSAANRFQSNVKHNHPNLDENQSNFNNPVNDKPFIESLKNQEIINDKIELSDDSNFSDFELPSKPEIECQFSSKVNNLDSLTFPNLEDIFNSFSPVKENVNISFVSPPRLCRKKLRSLFIRPFYVFDKNLDLQKKDGEINAKNFGSYFKFFTLSNLIRNEINPKFISFQCLSKDSFRNESIITSKCKKVSSSDIPNVSVDLIDLVSSPLDETLDYNVLKDINPTVGPTVRKSIHTSYDELLNLEPVEEKSKYPQKAKNILNDCSVLLTPPPAATKGNILVKNDVQSTSPFFKSRRPFWVEVSSSIYSSTPITSKARRLFGNSSVNITPISLSSKERLTSLADQNQPQTHEESVKQTIAHNGSRTVIYDTKSESRNEVRELKEVVKHDHEVNFDLTIDDELFANIDLESVMREAEAKYSFRKDEQNKPSEDHTHENLNLDTKGDKNTRVNIKTASSNLLTVTQVIDLVNEPNSASKALENTDSKWLKKNEVKSSDKPVVFVDCPSKCETISETRTKLIKNLSNEFLKEKINWQSGTKRKLYNDTNNDDVDKNEEIPFSTVNSSRDFSYCWIDCSKTNKREKQDVDSRLTSKSNDVQIKGVEEETRVQFHFGLDGFEDLLDGVNCCDSKTYEKNTSNEERNVGKKAIDRDLFNSSDDLFKDIDLPSAFRESKKESFFLKHKSGDSDRHNLPRASTCPSLNLMNQSINNELLLDDRSFAKSNQPLNSRTNVSTGSDGRSNQAHTQKETGMNLHFPELPKLTQNTRENPAENLTESLAIDSPVIQRKKTSRNFVDSECDDSVLDVNSNSKNNSTNGSFNKNNCPEFSILSDDDFEVRAAKNIQPLSNCKIGGKKKRKSKKKTKHLIEVEAEINNDYVVIVSSDESESSLDEYDSSFVDDDFPQTEQQCVDMQAFYLQSVRSPLKKSVQVGNARQNINSVLCQTADDFVTEDEEEDSFVVENDFVEYETEHFGDTMLAVDPIINQVILDEASSRVNNRKKIKKRRRIVEPNVSSEDENSPKKAKLSPSTNTLKNRMTNPSTNCLINNSTSLSKNSSTILINGITKPSKRKSIGPSTKSSRETAMEDGIPTFNIISDGEDFLIPVSKKRNISVTLSKVESEGSSFNEAIDSSRKSTVIQLPGGKSPKLGSRRKFGARSLSSSGSCSESAVQEETSLNGSQKVFGAEHPFDFTTPKSEVLSFKSSFSLSKCNEAERHCEEDRLSFEVPSKVNVSSKTTFGNRLEEDYQKSSNSIIQNVPGTSTDSANQDKICIIVDTSEVSIAGIIASTLRLKHGTQTYVTQVSPASYVISSRMAIFRQNHSVFANSVNRTRLIARFRVLLHTFERAVIILEKDPKTGTKLPPRTFYLDTISCACAQLPQLKILLSSDQNETADLIWYLTKQERLRGHSIPSLPAKNQLFEQAVKFYRSIPRVSCSAALFLALNFPTISEALNSDIEELKRKGRLSSEAALAFKTHVTRKFRKEFLPSSLRNESS